MLALRLTTISKTGEAVLELLQLHVPPALHAHYPCLSLGRHQLLIVKYHFLPAYQARLYQQLSQLWLSGIKDHVVSFLGKYDFNFSVLTLPRNTSINKDRLCCFAFSNRSRSPSVHWQNVIPSITITNLQSPGEPSAGSARHCGHCPVGEGHADTSPTEHWQEQEARALLTDTIQGTAPTASLKQTRQKVNSGLSNPMFLPREQLPGHCSSSSSRQTEGSAGCWPWGAQPCCGVKKVPEGRLVSPPS